MAFIPVVAEVTPGWVNITIAVSAFLTACGVFWRMVLKPGVRLVSLLQDLNPLLVNVVEAMHDTAEPFTVLDEIVHQFRTNSGSSLRDVINRLESASKISADALVLLAAAIKASSAVSDEDRQRIAKLINDVAELTAWRKDRQAEHPAERAAAQVVLDTEAARIDAAGVVLDSEKARQRAARKVLDTEDARQTAADVVLAGNPARELAADVVLHDDKARQIAAEKVLHDNDPDSDLPITVAPHDPE